MAIVRKLLLDIKNKSSHSVEFLLKEEVKHCLSTKGIVIRKFFAPLLRLVYRTQTEYKIKVVHREPLQPCKKGRIFAINHRQGDDIVIGANVVGKSGYIVFGNKYLALETSNGIGLWAYGTILLDRSDKQSRRSTYEKMKYVIEHGGNIIIYPEGYWNLDDNGEEDEYHVADGHKSDNWLIQDFNIGIFRLAQETGCEIVPVILHYDEYRKKICYGQRGKAITVNEKEEVFNKKEKLLTVMRTMYFEMMEKYSSYKRSELEVDGQTLLEQWHGLRSELIKACDIERIGYHLNLSDEKMIGKAKVVNEITTQRAAFSHLLDLKLNRQNAFLMKSLEKYRKSHKCDYN